MIYETDTDKVLVYNGSAWYANWNTAWGAVGLQTLTSIFTTSATHTTFQDTGMTLSVAEVSGRRYKITAIGNIYTPGGVQSLESRLLRDAAVLKQANWHESVMNSGNSLGVTFLTYIYTSVGSGSATYKIQMRAGVSNTSVSDYGDATFPRQFFVEDIGPA
jgi:hypothetical protein